MTDSSTSEGWSKKSNFTELIEDPIQAEVRIEVCRNDAKRNLEFQLKDYSQWFPGDHNEVADALSRDEDRTDEELTNLLHNFCPSQMPKHFKIVPLPAEIISFLASVPQKLPVKMQLQERHMRTKLGRGEDGTNGVNQLESSMTCTSTSSHDPSVSSSSELSPWLCAAGDFRDKLMIPWLQEQSKIPSHMWYRPSGMVTGQTQQKMKMGNLVDFYRGNTARTETKTQTQSSRKPYQQ